MNKGTAAEVGLSIHVRIFDPCNWFDVGVGLWVAVVGVAHVSVDLLCRLKYNNGDTEAIWALCGLLENERG